jgi:peptide/nickel transport system substrate-binding protein
MTLAFEADELRQKESPMKMEQISFFPLMMVLLWAAGAMAGPIEGTPRRGGTLINVTGSSPSNLTCGFEKSAHTNVVTESMYNGLVHPDAEGDLHPELARSWEISPDGLTYTFQLRKGVRWHDGQPFTSADVKFSYEEIVGKYHHRARATYERIKSIDTPDPHTVIIHLKSPYAPFLATLTVSDGCIMPKHIYAGTDILKNPHNQENPIGTGPFKLLEYQRGSHVILGRNPDYFMKGRPFLDRIIVKIIPNASSRVVAFESGELHMLGYYFLDPLDAKRLMEKPGVASTDLSDPQVMTLFLNYKKNKFLSDVRVRRAIAHAIDKKFIVERAMFGLGRVTNSIIPPGLKPFHTPKITLYEHSPSLADQMLNEAGFPRGSDGTRLELGLSYDSGAKVGKIVDSLREQLRVVGIRVKPEPMERQVMAQKVRKKRDFDMYVHIYTTSGEPAVGVERLYRCNSSENVTAYCNERVDQLWTAGITGTTNKDRAKAYFDIQEIVARELPSIPLAEPISVSVASDQFRGLFKAPTVYNNRLDEIWWVKGTPVQPDQYDGSDGPK